MHLDGDRLETLDLYDVLSGPPVPELQALVDLAALVCEAPAAAINLITSTEQHQLAAHGFDRSVCARADSMCAAVLGETASVVVVDASRDARFAANPFVTGARGSVRFYASAPLVVPSGITVGRLCVFDDEPRELGPQQAAALLTLAERVVDLLELRLRSRQLETSRRELTEARDELRRSNERLAVFADQVSHDLRGPLTAILMNAELLSDDPEVAAGGHASRFAAGIAEGARRMDQLIAQVLAHSRVGAGLRTRSLSLGEVFEHARSDLAGRAAESRAEIVVEELPTVAGDPDLLHAVALNLLGNALTFTRPGVPPVVRVSADSVDGRAVVRIRDNGTGVAPELREKAFTHFARGDHEAEGSGIGLATCRRIVEAHGGRITIEATDLPGTTVCLDLPLG